MDLQYSATYQWFTLILFPVICLVKLKEKEEAQEYRYVKRHHNMNYIKYRKIIYPCCKTNMILDQMEIILFLFGVVEKYLVLH